jgi:hypothetical protein
LFNEIFIIAGKSAIVLCIQHTVSKITAVGRKKKEIKKETNTKPACQLTGFLVYF